MFKRKRRNLNSVDGYPLGLTKGEIQQLRDLRSRPQFDIFVGLMMDIVEHNAEVLLEANDTHFLHEQRGFIKGLRRAATLIPTLLEAADRIDHDRRHQEASRNGKPDPRTFIGTPFWDGIQERFGRSER